MLQKFSKAIYLLSSMYNKTLFSPKGNEDVFFGLRSKFPENHVFYRCFSETTEGHVRIKTVGFGHILFIWTILYGPYSMDHTVWTIQYGPYSMIIFKIHIYKILIEN